LRRFAVTPGAWAWVALAAVLAAGALLGQRVEPTAIDWQPSLAVREPWRALSALGVHYSALHLRANLAGTLLVAALGVAAQLTRRAAAAWALACPLTQLALLAQPALLHYGGLSGVLHAGVAVVGMELLIGARGARRVIGEALLVGLALKVGLETPWHGPLSHPPGWDIAVAPFAHATGLVTGIGCALLFQALRRR
jgi:rhomboid family GlyGly-CTERM serine protease